MFHIKQRLQTGNACAKNTKKVSEDMKEMEHRRLTMAWHLHTVQHVFWDTVIDITANARETGSAEITTGRRRRMRRELERLPAGSKGAAEQGGFYMMQKRARGMKKKHSAKDVSHVGTHCILKCNVCQSMAYFWNPFTSWERWKKQKQAAMGK
ncbi:unnamed protein product [Pleuronectes platessa]|uniref:Uncharacterized protein n=1 Tax=Pleuronectes platessa TaxID=8262 RepID=A0A9N7VQ14_PLEPL|nr:unnamed protein product [Pleuronectes platessa]